jgi:hypothetical protein
MQKVDYRKDLKALYGAKAGKPAVVDVPPLQFLKVDGQGDPNTSPDYAAAVEALYAVSYATKFLCRAEQEIDYGVMPLEGLWWADDMRDFAGNRDAWQWTSMIMQPEIVTAGLVARAIEQVARKKALPALDRLRFEPYHEGVAAQVLHRGPWSEEGPVIEGLHAWIAAQGGSLTGHHHEIYLGDPRRAAPEKLRTIIRQPFQPAPG